jgi:hypothetical protein
VTPTAKAIACAVLVVAGSLAHGTVAAADHIYVEDFTTTAYRDAVNTTAVWDTLTGELRLPVFDGPSIEGVCYTTGDAWDVAVDGDFAYLADGDPGLKVIYIVDPTSPVQVAVCNTPGSARSVAVAGDYAYVVDTDVGLQVVDISDPVHPALLGSCDVATSNPSGVAIAGNYAYVGDYSEGLKVVDISDPTNPVPAGGCDTPGYARAVALAGNYAYVAAGTAGMQVIDVADPTTPVLVGGWDTPSSAIDVAVAGDCAYVADFASGLQLIDVTDPANPSILGDCDTPGEAYGVAIDGDYAYVADRASGLQVVSIVDPEGPVSLGGCDTPGSAYAVALAGEYAYVADYTSSLQVIHISSPSTPTVSALLDTADSTLAIAVEGNCAYVADLFLDLRVFDVTDPVHPSLVGGYATPTGVIDVAVSGARVYVLENGLGLRVLGVSDPTNPVSMGYCSIPGDPEGIAVDGDNAFVAAGWGGLQVLDVRTVPFVVGSLSTIGEPSTIVVVGDVAYLGEEEAGIELVDISDPSNPTALGSHATPSEAHGIAVSGNYAYVAANQSGLLVFDVGDPMNPIVVGQCLAPDHAYCVAVAGDLAFVGNWTGALHVIDVTDPTNPVAIDWGYSLSCMSDVAIAGDYAYTVGAWGDNAVMRVMFRTFDPDANVARSLTIGAPVDGIAKVRLTPVQTDSIRWEVSTSGGANWQVVQPGEWRRVGPPDTDLRWRSTHVPLANPVANPACTSLTIQWLYEYATVDDVADVPNDQGGRVRLSVARSGFDVENEQDYPIATYNVWRRVDDAATLRELASPCVGVSAARIEETAGTGCAGGIDRESLAGLPFVDYEDRLFAVGGEEAGRGSLPPGTWEVMGSFAGAQQDVYLYEATTLADSSGAGVPYSVFCVTAHTTTPSIWYASPPDSGYSVDNMVPEAPSNLLAEGGPVSVLLSWDANVEHDLDYYAVYRDTIEGFSPGTPIGYTVEETYEDTDPPEVDEWWYKVTAWDFHDNESEPSEEVSILTSGVDEDLPSTFSLAPPVPNPLTTGAQIGFVVPAGGEGTKVTVAIYDVSGHKVITLLDRAVPAGSHALAWDGRDTRGHDVASGVYFCRMEAGAFSSRRKMVLLR